MIFGQLGFFNLIDNWIIGNGYFGIRLFGELLLSDWTEMLLLYERGQLRFQPVDKGGGFLLLIMSGLASILLVHLRLRGLDLEGPHFLQIPPELGVVGLLLRAGRGFG